MPIALIITLLVWIVAIGGWIANIVKLIALIGHVELLTLLPVLRIIGVIVGPLGSILGFVPN